MVVNMHKIAQITMSHIGPHRVIISTFFIMLVIDEYYLLNCLYVLVTLFMCAVS